MQVSIFKPLAAVLLLIAIHGTQIAAAGDLDYIEFSDRISEGSNLTYLDLALQFAPGLARTPMDGSDLSKLRHVDADGEVTVVTKPELGSIERVDIALDGKPALLLLFDLGNANDAVARVNVLALYDISGVPKLLDAIDVGLDRESSFTDQAYLALSPGSGMALIRNSHHNAGEEYLQTSLIGIWGGKLHDVDTVSSYSWMSGDMTVETRARFAAVNGAVALDATFSIKTTRCDGVCEADVPHPFTTETVTAHYRWDAASGKFLRPEDAFDKVPLPNMEE